MPPETPPYFAGVRLVPERVTDPTTFPFSLPIVQNLDLASDRPVTIFAFLAIIQSRFDAGMFLLDEPEPALSPHRRLHVLAQMYRMQVLQDPTHNEGGTTPAGCNGAVGARQALNNRFNARGGPYSLTSQATWSEMALRKQARHLGTFQS